MRIIGGNQKGKRLFVSKKGIRPTKGLVREAIFSVIQDRIPLARVLDIFAGSGALGLEALSRGAARCVFIEQFPDVLRKNIQNIAGHEENTVIRKDYRNALMKMQKQNFSIIFLDPPYNKNLVEHTIALIAQQALLETTGIIVIEHHPKEVFSLPEGFSILKKKQYGKTNVTFVTRTQA